MEIRPALVTEKPNPSSIQVRLKARRWEHTSGPTAANDLLLLKCHVILAFTCGSKEGEYGPVHIELFQYS